MSKLASNDMEFIFCEIKSILLKSKVLKYLRNHSKEYNADDIKEILEYHNGKIKLGLFPVFLEKTYDKSEVKIEKDKETGLFYTYHNDKKMYFRRKYKSAYRAQRYYNNLRMEQDINSPHRYLTDKFNPNDNSIVLDIGGAEGFFSLDVIDKAKKIYIFECDNDWIEALKNTFKEYGDKVEIVKKYVSSKTDENNITIDDFIKEKEISGEDIFIKMDIEGAELEAIQGATNTIINNNVSMAVCTYHNQNHEEEIRKIFKDYNMESSNGYMLYYYDFEFLEPYIRRGVLRIYN